MHHEVGGVLAATIGRLERARDDRHVGVLRRSAKAVEGRLRLSFRNWVGCHTATWPFGPTTGAMISAQYSLAPNRSMTLHPALQAEEAQHLGRLARFVELHVVRRSGPATRRAAVALERRRRLGRKRRARPRAAKRQASRRACEIPLCPGDALYCCSAVRASVTQSSLIGARFSIRVRLSSHSGGFHGHHRCTVRRPQIVRA